MDLRGPVRRRVGEHEVHVQLLGQGFVDRYQELLALDGALPALRLVNHHSGGHIERGEQAGDTMTHVVVGVPLGSPRAQGQDRLGPVEDAATVEPTTLSDRVQEIAQTLEVTTRT